jgi:DNA modification methylase
MDWRHCHEMLVAGREVYCELKNLCVWSKTNAGMGSLYRSRHELVFVYKNGRAPHINNVELGKHGRSRSNVWTYPGVNAFGAGRLDELRMHPTVKPVTLVADAILDCSKRGGLVLDCFVGSGTTILAAERTGRQAYGMEIDPGYVEVAINRWQDLTGETARHAETKRSLDELHQDRWHGSHSKRRRKRRKRRLPSDRKAQAEVGHGR